MVDTNDDLKTALASIVELVQRVALKDQRIQDQAGALLRKEAEIGRLRAALEEIAEVPDPFSRDNHQFAINVIEESKRIANEALSKKRIDTTTGAIAD